MRSPESPNEPGNTPKWAFFARRLAPGVRSPYSPTPRCSSHTGVIHPQVVVLLHRSSTGFPHDSPQMAELPIRM